MIDNVDRIQSMVDSLFRLSLDSRSDFLKEDEQAKYLEIFLKIADSFYHEYDNYNKSKILHINENEWAFHLSSNSLIEESKIKWMAVNKGLFENLTEGYYDYYLLEVVRDLMKVWKDGIHFAKYAHKFYQEEFPFNFKDYWFFRVKEFLNIRFIDKEEILKEIVEELNPTKIKDYESAYLIYAMFECEIFQNIELLEDQFNSSKIEVCNGILQWLMPKKGKLGDATISKAFKRINERRSSNPIYKEALLKFNIIN